MAATIKVPTVFTAEDKFSSVVRRMTTGVKKFSQSGVAAVQRFDNKISNTFSKLDVWSQRFIGLGAGLLAKSAFDDIRNFEENLVGVGKTTGSSGKELLDLGDEFIDLSKKMRSVSTDKLLELGQVGGQLGITGSKNLLKFSSTLAMLEKSSDIQGEQGATDVARIIGLAGEGIDTVDRFSSALVGLGNSSKATEGEILGVASEVARATATYKLGSTTLLGISTALKSLGAKPEAAGTAVGKVFREIEGATIKGGKILSNFSKVLGVSDAEVKRLFTEDKEALFKKFIGGLDGISKQGGSVQKTLDSLGLSGETVAKGIGPLATNYDLLNEKLDLAAKEYERNAALQEEYAAAANTINAAMQSVTIGFSNFITKATNSEGPLGAVRDVLFFIGRNMDIIVPLVLSLVAAFVLLKAIVWTIQAVTWIYNTALGINTALQKKNLMALRGNAIALRAYAAAQWVVNAAMSANPIGLVIAAIVALIGVVYAIVKYYNEWGAAATMLLGPLGAIINVVMGIRKYWDDIVGSFKEGGFIAGIKKIGLVIMDSMLYPIQQFLSLISNIPGVGKMIEPALRFVDKMKNNVQDDIISDRPSKATEIIGSPSEKNGEILRENRLKGRLDVNLNDPGNNVNSVTPSGDSDFPIVTTTQGNR